MTTTARTCDLVGTRPTLSMVAPGGDVTRRVAVTVDRPVELSADRRRCRLIAGGVTIIVPAAAPVELEEPL